MDVLIGGLLLNQEVFCDKFVEMSFLLNLLLSFPKDDLLQKLCLIHLAVNLLQDIDRSTT